MACFKFFNWLKELVPLTPRNTATVRRLEFRDVKETSSSLLTKRNFFILMYLVCITGCVYQITTVSIQYFDYETVTQLEIVPVKRIIPPAVSICFPYISLIELPLLFARFPKFREVAERIRNETSATVDMDTYRIKAYKTKPFDFEFGKAIEDNLTLAEILPLTTQFGDILTKCSYVHPDRYRAVDARNLSECLDVFELGAYVRDENKCFMLSYKNPTNKEYIYDMKVLTSGLAAKEYFQYIRVNTTRLGSNVEKMYLYFHPNYRLPRGRVDAVKTIQDVGQFPTVSKMTFKMVKTTLLEEPYPTNCVNYPDIGFESRYERVDLCTMERSYKAFGKVPVNMVFDKKLDYLILGFKHFSRNESLFEEVTNIRDGCLEEFPSPDCVNEYYMPETVVTDRSEELGFLVVPPTSLRTTAELNPDLTLMQYIIYHFSTYGFWFGFCFLQLADVIMYIGSKVGKTKCYRSSSTTDEQ